MLVFIALAEQLTHNRLMKTQEMFVLVDAIAQSGQASHIHVLMVTTRLSYNQLFALSALKDSTVWMV